VLDSPERTIERVGEKREGVIALDESALPIVVEAVRTIETE
jgi:hypothetical protein